MKPMSRMITAIAWPAIISNITTPLLSLADTAIVGHFGSAAYIGAIALGASMFNMLYWLFGFLRMGSSGMTAQAYGANDRKTASLVLWRSLVVALSAGVLMLMLASPIASLMLPFFDTDAATSALARRYFLIAVCGAPATLSVFALSGWFLGMQDSRTPMWTALITNVVNIAVSLMAVYVFGLRIEGVAIGSAVAQWTGFVFAVAVAALRYSPQRCRWREIADAAGLKRFFSVNADIFLRTLCLVAVTLWFTRTGAGQGVDVLAANALLLQLFMFFSYFMDGFAFAGEALAGLFHGAGDKSSLRLLIASLMRAGAVLAAVFSAVYMLCGGELLSLLTDDAAVLRVCADYRMWAVAVPLAGTMAFVWDGILIGLTRTRIMLVSMASASAVFFLTVGVSRHALGNHGLWLAFVVYLALRGGLEYLIYQKKY